MTGGHKQRVIPSTPVPVLARIEGAAVGIAAAVLFVVAGFDWWWLFAVFLLFDLPMVGYLVSDRVGAIAYNAAHNYAVPAVLLVAAVVAPSLGWPSGPFAFLAGCWFFHVGVDRAVGFGPRPLR